MDGVVFQLTNASLYIRALYKNELLAIWNEPTYILDNPFNLVLIMDWCNRVENLVADKRKK